MKGKLLIILSGVALLHLFLLGGLALTGGCSSTDDEQPINDQNYVPAPTAESSQPATVAPVAQSNELAPATPGIGFTPPPAPAQEFMQPAPVKSDLLKYTVQKGDSLWRVARKYGVSVDELASYNQLGAKSLKVGQTITIPPGGRLLDGSEKAEAKHAAAATSSAASSKKVVKKPVASPAPSASAKKEEPKADKADKAEGSAGEYAVQKGDTLEKIAKKHHVKIADLASANNISVDKTLHIGQKLTIPKGGVAVKESAKADAKEPVKEAKAASSKKGHADKKDSADKASADKASDKSSSEPAAKPKTSDSLLDEIPSPDEGAPAGKAEGSVKPLASNAAVNSAASVAGEKPASSGYTAEVDQDTTVEKLATQYGCKADDIKKLNPELPADGKIKAGSVVKIP